MEFREKIKGIKGLQEKDKKRTSAKWIEEKRKPHGGKMREHWKKRKKREKES